MRFAVILSYSGLIQHYWIYDLKDYDFAKDQFDRLNEAFIEVNESQVFLFKIGPKTSKAMLSDMVKQLFISL